MEFFKSFKMMVLERSFVILAIVLFVFSCKTNKDNFDYFGLQTPSEKPQEFHPGFLPDSICFEGMAISPDGDEVHFQTTNFAWNNFVIYYTEKTETGWSNLKKAGFSKRGHNMNPVFYSPDTLFFMSLKPVVPPYNTDLCFSIKENGVWLSPQKLPHPINTSSREYLGSFSNSGNMYYVHLEAFAEKGKSDNNIYVSNYSGYGFSDPVMLDSTVNSGKNEYSPFVSPCESYLLFSSDREGGYGFTDIYVCKKLGNGKWSQAKNLGNAINTDAYESNPLVSQNGRYLFFSRRYGTVAEKPSRIFWVDFKVVKAVLDGIE